MKQGEKDLENQTECQIDFCGFLGKALDSFCARIGTGAFYDRLLEPYRLHNSCAGSSAPLHWGELVSASLLLIARMPGCLPEEKILQTLYAAADLQSPDGTLSAYSRNSQLQHLDLAGRRYVLRAMLLGAAFFGNDQRLADCAVRMTDQLMSVIGPGKRSILHCGQYGGLDSSSILDAVTGVYRLTGEKRFLEFARYIADTGCSQQHNIFQALMNGMEPSELGNGNAVYLNGCFKGLAELCKADPEYAELYRPCCRRYLAEISAKELFVTGSGGGGSCGRDRWFRGVSHQHEENVALFSAANAAVTNSCLEFFEAMAALGEPLPALVPAERAVYNALPGAWNMLPEDPEPGQISPFAGAFALVPRLACTAFEDGVMLNFYENAELMLPHGVRIGISGDFPASGSVEITLRSRRPFAVSLRIPEYCTGVYYCNCLLDWHKNSYLTIKKPWHADEILKLEFDPKVRRIDACGKAPFEALMRGPVVLAADEKAESSAFLRLQHNKQTLIDCASAGGFSGKDGALAVWFKKLLPNYLYYYFDYD